MYVRDSASLARLCRDLAQAGAFGLDTEFIGESSYAPRLCLIQVSWPDRQAVIDPLVPGLDLKPFLALIPDPEVQKVFHAGGQDMAIFYSLIGQPPRRVFDTQVAAALVGYGDQVGYAALVERALHGRLSKQETFTDWARRPLTAEQIAYAMDDVKYLLPLRDHLVARLSARGRLAWLDEELRRFEQGRTYERDAAALVRRIRRARSLDGAALAVLRELVAWREEEARRRDQPRGRIVSDDMLIQIAKRSPRSAADLEAVRGLPPCLLDRPPASLFAAVERGLRVPAAERPQLPPVRGDNPAQAAIVDLLEVVVRLRAQSTGVATTYLATRQDLKDLVDSHCGVPDPEAADLPVLSGWRRELVGEDLLDILEGRASLGVVDGEVRKLAS